MDADSPADVRLTDIQLGILAALCKPVSSGNQFATPATDQEIADQVFLSVDAVKGHLRMLYRTFGIEDLPHNRKRARLVELAIAGGYVKQEEPTGPITEAERIARTRPPKKGPSRPWLRPVVTSIVLILVIGGSVLATSGILGSSPTPTPEVPTPAAYRTEVAGSCRLALAGAPETAGQSRAEIAGGYLQVIETMRGRLQSLTAPSIGNLALERFGQGLANAANYTSAVAQSPPARGSPAEAKDVAELTFAAGQVQAGAVGYELGQDCLAIGDLVARSAENAVAP